MVLYVLLTKSTFARSINLRDGAYLKEALESMLQLMFDDWSSVQVPSAATLSRARRKLDVAMMYHRRQELRDIGIKNLSIQLGLLQNAFQHFFVPGVNCNGFFLQMQSQNLSRKKIASINHQCTCLGAGTNHCV